MTKEQWKHMRDATHLVGCIIIVGSCALGIGRDQVIAADVADDAAVLLFCHNLVSAEDELYKPVAVPVISVTVLHNDFCTQQRL